MAHSKLVIGSYTIDFHGDKKYSVKWDLKLEDAGIFPKPNRTRTVAAAALNFESIDVFGQIISSELVGKTADKYVFDTILPALGLIKTQTTGTLTLELNGGQLVATGWVTNMMLDRFVESGIEMIDVSFTFVLDQPPTHSGLT
jgi:hypothetical protein